MVTTLRWGRWRPPRRSCWWSRNQPAHIDQGIGPALRGAAGGFAVDVAGGGEPQGGVDDGAAFGIEAARELAAPVQDAGQVQRPLRGGRSGSSPNRASARRAQILHGGGGIADRQRGQLGDQLGFVVGEQADSAVLEVDDDRLDLPTRQHTVAVGGGGDGELTKPAGGSGAAGGLAAGLAGVVAQPRGHGGGAVVAPDLGGVVVADGGEKLGIEPIGQRERFDRTALSMGRSRSSIA